MLRGLKMSSTETHLCGSEQDTLELAKLLAERLSGKKILVYLEGDLGAGKTTLVRGVLRAMGCETKIKSPTYTLVETYDLPGLRVNHFDLYRMEDPEELEFMGGREYFEDALCFIEWPEKGTGWLPDPDLYIGISMHGNARQIALKWQNSPT